MQSFRNLESWRRAHALALRVYGIANHFPKDEVFGVTALLRRAAVAVPMRIVQACGSDGVVFGQEIRKAAGLSCDLEYTLLLASDLGYIPDEACEELMAESVEIRKMLFGLLRSL